MQAVAIHSPPEPRGGRCSTWRAGWVRYPGWPRGRAVALTIHDVDAAATMIRREAGKQDRTAGLALAWKPASLQSIRLLADGRADAIAERQGAALVTAAAR